METMFVTSYITLWVIVLLLIFAFGMLARQIGLLHMRMAPVGARMTSDGPEIDEVAPRVFLEEQLIEVGGPQSKPTLLVFVSAGCPSCSELAPHLLRLWKDEGGRINFVLASLTKDKEANEEFVAAHGLGSLPYITSPDVSTAYKIHNAPYGVLIDKDGMVRAKGLVNTMEHLESLLNAVEVGEPTLESYMRKRTFQPSMETEASSNRV
jgi:methylamine dehydrogenase accessory protein MauD